jgi:phosphate transport system ATP-binding protein
LHQPHERHDPDLPGRGRSPSTAQDIYDQVLDVGAVLRARVGMVFQKPNPFPKSIYENVAYGPRIHGIASSKATSTSIVEASAEEGRPLGRGEGPPQAPAPACRAASSSAWCIARAIAVNPEVILMDEPCSALDPIATARIEELIDELRRTSPSSSSPTRCSRPRACRNAPPSSTWACWSRRGPTDQIFTNPRESRTQDYITGRFG